MINRLRFTSKYCILNPKEGCPMAPVYQKNVKYTLASHAVERLRPSNDAIELMQKMSDGKINADDAVNQLLKKYGVSQGKRHG